MPDSKMKKIKKIIKKCREVFVKKEQKKIKWSNSNETRSTGQKPQEHAKDLSNTGRTVENTSTPTRVQQQTSNDQWLPEHELCVTNLNSQCNIFGFMINSPATEAFDETNISTMAVSSNSKKKHGKILALMSFGWPFRRKRKHWKNYSSLSADFTDKKKSTPLHKVLNSKYAKFMPVAEPEKDLLPMADFDKRYPLPWFDAQAWYQSSRQKGKLMELSVFLADGEIHPKNKITANGLQQSKSDSNIAEDEDNTRDMLSVMHRMKQRRKNLKKLKKSSMEPWNTFTQAGCTPGKDILTKTGGQGDCTATSVPVCEVCSPPYSPVSLEDDYLMRTTKRHPPSKIRFGVINEAYCKNLASIVENRIVGNVLSDGVSIKIELYIQYQSTENMKMLHLKTEMAHLCLKSFFFPVRDAVNINWLRNLKTSVVDNLTKDQHGCLKDVFGRTKRVLMDETLMVMFLTKSAVIFLKHQNLCLLETLSVCLDVDQHSILLLDTSYKPQVLVH